jgi:hypothetical protein
MAASRANRTTKRRRGNSLNVRWWALLPEMTIDIITSIIPRLERYIARPVVFLRMTVVVDLPIPFGAPDEQA